MRSLLLGIFAAVAFASLMHVPALGADKERSRSDGVYRLKLLPPGPGNPRNSEGDFIRLQDGRIMFVYSHFVGGAGDNAAAFLAARYSSDGGFTWTDEDVVIVPNEGGLNVMSVSLLRLKDGRIALFYLRKNSTQDCRPVLRFSNDEGQTWSEPKLCIDEVGYYVMNNDRAVQLSGGRIILPVALHNRPGWKRPDWHGRIMCYYSDDNGETWQRSRDELVGYTEDGRRVVTQEPGVVELKDGRLMLFCRTNAGSQWIAYSTDRGETWSSLRPSNIISPLSPASIERIPSTGDLLLVWNDHSNITSELRGKRTPLCVAVSKDEGETWQYRKVLEDNPHGWYCYTAIEFLDNAVLLAHCAGDRRENNGLALTQITRFSLNWLYGKQ